MLQIAIVAGVLFGLVFPRSTINLGKMIIVLTIVGLTIRILLSINQATGKGAQSWQHKPQSKLS